MILVDTSAWVDFFRGRGRLLEPVDEALALGQAALCGPIVTELRRGLSAPQRKRVLTLLSGCHLLEAPQAIWSEAGDLGFFLARRGVAAKTLDLLIAVCALSHDVELLTGDRDFYNMAKAGVSLRLVQH